MKKTIILLPLIIILICSSVHGDTSRWKKLNYLLPDPLCRMSEDVNGVLQITEWNDVRPQPSDTAIDTVDDQDVIDSELAANQESKFNQDIIKAIGLTMKDFMNEMMSGRTTSITNSELKIKFKSYLN